MKKSKSFLRSVLGLTCIYFWIFCFAIAILPRGVQTENGINYKPIFSQGQVVKTISEDSAPGVPIAYLARIVSDRENDKITFSIDAIGGLICNIDTETGNITLKSRLDREAEAKYKFQAFAQDDYQGGGVNRRTGVWIYLYVLDVNDNPPFFEGTPYIKSVLENATRNSLVITVHATDRDEGINRDITYSFKNGTSMNKFTIDSSKGEVRVAAQLDYESVQRHTLIVVAKDDGEVPLSSQTTLIIDVKDVSDSKPRFLLSSYQSEIAENSPRKTEVATVAAIDGDIGINNPINYDILSGNDDNLFQIDQNHGKIVVNGLLDMEKQSLYSLKVKGYEVPDSSSFALVDVIIFVKDVNDNKPQFRQKLYHIKLNENTPIGYVVIERLDAKDNDVLPQNNQIVYSMAGDIAPFSINPTTGQLKVNGTLNYESQINYTIIITATEKNTKEKYSGSTKVIVELLNVNDHSPHFTEKEYNFTIKEDIKRETEIGQVKATDGDKGLFGQVVYEITGATSNIFRINSSNGKIFSTQKLDFDKKQSYNFVVLGKDQAGIYTKVASTIVSIFLQDVNDNAPEFIGLPSEIAVEEDSSSRVILTIHAKDSDSGENGKVVYTLLNSSVSEFSLDSTSGALKLIQKLDFESKKEFLLGIAATDKGTPPQRSTALLKVKVKDVNDNKPVFNQSTYVATLNEAIRIGSSVVTVYATDADGGLNARITYAILSGNEDNSFHISTKGEITTRNSLDRESKDFYKLIVVASDSGSPRQSSNATVVVHITDSNDHLPRFDQVRYHVNVTESEKIGQSVAKVHARDPDYEKNSQIRYSLKSGNEENKFRIDQNLGIVYINGDLDWERTIFYTLVVEASDGGTPPNSRTALLTVEVLDSNDNSPIFREKSYFFLIFENSPLRASLGLVWADDRDGKLPPNRNGIVAYRITSGNDDGSFEIDPKFGTIRTNSSLDREEKAHYSLIVTAIDGGSPARSTTVPVSVEVIDLNDNKPKFSQSTYSAEVKEDSGIGTFIVKVSAEDADAGINGKVQYAISSGNAEQIFVIDQDGIIKTNKTLDRESRSEFDLTISASDSASSKQSSSSRVVVKVLDVNDNFPIFNGLPSSVLAMEEKDQGQLVTTVKATDKDSQANSKLTYKIVTSIPFNHFAISSSGRITTTAKLDRESISEYFLNISATDGGSPSRTSYASLKIVVQDINDHKPIITNLPNTVKVSENTGGGVSVFTIIASDKDEGRNKKLSFFLLSGSHGKFRIDENTGVIRTSPSRLDRESLSRYDLKINVTDHGTPVQWTTSHLIIDIDDVNDNAPRFIPNPELSPGVYTTRIEEGVGPVGQVIFDVNATDADSGPNAVIKYEIVTSESSSYFVIDSVTGKIKVANPVDRESSSMLLDSNGLGKLEVTIKASDNAKQNQLFSTTKIVITVTDINDNPPKFASSVYIGSITEGSRITHDVVQVIANDGDLGYNARIQYSIVSGNIGGVFTILNSFVGKISVAKILNSEQISTYNLTVMARDDASAIGGTSLSSTAKVYIYVGDINDNDPVFTKASYSASLPENAKIGFQVTQVTAVDPDKGDNGNVSYSITDGNEEKKFLIDRGNGKITLDGKLDREKTPKYTLTIQAQDKGFPAPRKSFVPLQIIVEDVNDNKPDFPFSVYEGHVRENVPSGTKVTVGPILATDADAGVNKVISYSISGTTDFAINSSTAEIITKSTNLDREKKAKYEFTVTATDIGGLKSTAKVQINLDDVNDNSPVFAKSVYNVTVSEDAVVGHLLARVTASDSDDGLNADLTYSLTGGEGKFYVDRTRGEIRLNSKLDREATKTFTVDITAVDAGKPSKDGSAKVWIEVLDVLDSAPIFSPSIVSVKVLENVSPRSVIYQAKAIDTDVNDTIKYTVTRQSVANQFSVEELSGKLILNRPLDRENISFYSIYIRATDSVGLSSKNQDLKIEIEVTDVNDNKPLFLRPRYYNEIVENTPNGAIILTIQAQDADIGKNREIRYSFVEDMSRILRIDSVRGLVSKQGSFSSVSGKMMNFTVQASDLGSPPTSNTVPCTIVWVDVNDNSPKFEKSQYTAKIREDSSVNTTVLQLIATEQDQGRNGKIKYYMLGSQGTFVIDINTGIVKVAKRLDRETQHTYTMTATAQDSGIPPKQGMASVTISILDANDKVPKFDAAFYTFSIREDVAKDHIIGTTKATDDDIEENSKIKYRITKGDRWNWFYIDSTTGSIKTKDFVDREKTSLVLLEVKATDSGLVPLSSTVSVTINILDVNDNAPTFEKDVYNVTIKEDAFRGKQVTTVQAKDDDLGRNSDITYEISSGNIGNSFAIAAKTGVITISNPLDYEVRSHFDLTVKAIDGGEQRKSSTCHVMIIITDVNDNLPQFGQNAYVFGVFETAPKNYFIGNVSATDLDKTITHRLIFYQIKSGNEDNAFHIKETTGQIFLNREVDREKKASYSLTVTAYNKDHNGKKTMPSDVSVTLNILDVNDNSPFFQPHCCNASVSEGASEGDSIMRLSATDYDDGSNKAITYSIISGNDLGLFSVTNPLGELKVAKKLDREKAPSHMLVVRASDQGVPVLSANATVKIKVLDINDERPIFQPIVIKTLPENATVGTSVTTFIATDKDLGENSKIRFYIINGNEEGVFVLNATTGVLRTSRPLDYERTSRYRVRVEAIDQGVPPLSMHKIFDIQLSNINDNIPIFLQAKATVSVRENKPSGSYVAKITAIDADRDKIYYYISDGNEKGLFEIDSNTGVLTTTRILDRETQQLYRLKVTASNERQSTKITTRKKRAVALRDNSVALKSQSVGSLSTQTVLVMIADDNDNPPRFIQYEFNGGVSEDAKYDSSILQVQAIDKDTGNSTSLVYSFVDVNKDNAFVMERETGWIKTAILFSGKTGTSYNFKVIVKDNNGKRPYFNHTANVKIFVLTDMQRVVLTMSVIPDTVKESQDKFKRVLENVTGFIINIDEVQYSTNNGKIDFSASDMLIHAVDPKTNKILNRDVVIEKIDKNYPLLQAFFTQWKVTSVKAKLSPAVQERSSNTTAVLIGIAITLLLVVIGFAFALYHLRKRQRRKLKAATASAANADAELKQRVQMHDITENGSLEPKVYTIEGSTSPWYDQNDGWMTKGSLRSANSGSEFLSTFQRNGIRDPPQGATEIYLPDVYTDIDVDEDELESESSEDEDEQQVHHINHRIPSRADLLLAASYEGLGTLEKDGNLVTAI